MTRTRASTAHDWISQTNRVDYLLLSQVNSGSIENKRQANSVVVVVFSYDLSKRSTRNAFVLFLLLVLSDADATSLPRMPTERTDNRLLSVDDSEKAESTTGTSCQFLSMSSSSHLLHPREQNVSDEPPGCRRRRRSWIASQSNQCPSADLHGSHQQDTSLLRQVRTRLGQSEPNLRSFTMSISSPIKSPSVKTSPRASSAANQTGFQFPSRRSSQRRPHLAGLNLVNLKYALRHQPSTPQSATASSLVADLVHDADDDINRRWSCTSGPSSSGYGTASPTPTSPYSSIERLQNQLYICTCHQQIDHHAHDDLQRLESRSISMSLLDANISSASSCSSLAGKLKMTSSVEHENHSLAAVYKERYPKAKIQMEERLENFIETFKCLEKYDYCSDGSARFIHNQIVELAKDCHEKSTHDLINTLYFNEMTNNLERLLLNVKDKCPQSIDNIETIVRKLLLIIARSARLLECLQFDPEDFLRVLDEVECQAKTLVNIKQNIPKYICSKLNLDRNPLDVIHGLQVRTSETTISLDPLSLSRLSYSIRNRI